MGPHNNGRVADDVRVSLEAFRRIVQTLRTSAREAEQRTGLTSAQLLALQQLVFSPGASVNDLAALTFTHQSSVSVVVRRLVTRRLVQKVASEDDRRRVRLQLTSTGAALVRRSPDPGQERLISGISSLAPAARRAFARSLSEIAQAVSAGSGSNRQTPRRPRPTRRRSTR
jgi:DNA-binding MarR family transcriptional regulator